MERAKLCGLISRTILEFTWNYKGWFITVKLETNQAKVETYLLSELLSLLVQILGGKPALEMKSLLKMAALPRRRL